MTSPAPPDEPAEQRRSRTRSRRPDRSRPSNSTMRTITFVDANDPDVRSTIMRHTAYYSSRERRRLRMQSVSSPPRLLEWTLRSPSANESTAPPDAARTAEDDDNDDEEEEPPMSSNSPSIPDVPMPYVVPAALGEPPSSIMTDGLGQAGEGHEDGEGTGVVLDYLTQNLCRHLVRVDLLRDMIAFARDDEACLPLLVGYAVYLRQHHEQDPNGLEQDRARGHLNRGTRLLRDRLGQSQNAATLENIQAVLLLIAITADFGDHGQVQMHWNALQRMLAMRSDEPVNPVIQRQIEALPHTKSYHLTMPCEPFCDCAPRFGRAHQR